MLGNLLWEIGKTIPFVLILGYFVFLYHMVCVPKRVPYTFWQEVYIVCVYSFTFLLPAVVMLYAIYIVPLTHETSLLVAFKHTIIVPFAASFLLLTYLREQYRKDENKKRTSKISKYWNPIQNAQRPQSRGHFLMLAHNTEMRATSIDCFLLYNARAFFSKTFFFGSQVNQMLCLKCTPRAIYISIITHTIATEINSF